MKSRTALTLPVIACAALATLAFESDVHAGSTRLFSLDSSGVLSAGKLEGTAVLSTGAVVPSVETRRIELPNVGLARSLLVLADGRVLIGTGNDGRILQLVGDDVKELADTGELLVTSLVLGHGGKLYAGTLPKGRIYEIDPRARPRALPATPPVAGDGKASPKKPEAPKAATPGAVAPAKAPAADKAAADAAAASKAPFNATLFCTPEGAEHVWALVYDAAKKSLFAATGPDGKVFAVDAKGKAEVYYDSEASHVMALAAGKGGVLYAGTSDDALLLSLAGPGRAEVLYDFEGNEVTALAVDGERIAVAANLFPKAPTKAKPKTGNTDGKSDKDDDKSDDNTTAKADTSRPKPGKGELWVVEPGGRARKRWSSDEGHITALQWAPEDVLYVASGKGGHIHRVQPDGTFALWIDVDERQVLDLQLTGKDPLFVTGDAGAVYRVLPGKARSALWTSKVLDAGFHSRWGELTWRGRGGLSFQTRTGNTEKPDDSWSEWSAVLTRPGPVRSAASRFLQLRARLATDGAEGDVALYAVQTYYQPNNQPPTVQQVTVKPKTKKDADGEHPTAIYGIEWTVDNPDQDRLRYRLHFRPEGRPVGRPILRDSEILTKTSHDWDTQPVPDGYYRVRVTASDELDNPAPQALEHATESEPFLLDNHGPAVEGLRHVGGGRVLGTARDSIGPITALEYALDGEEWKPLSSVDGLFDTAVEAFELRLPTLERGPHVVAVRATDSRNNRASAELWFTAP